MATVNGVRIKSAEITLPFRGVWTADITTEDDLTATSVAIELADLTLVGTIERSGNFLGSGSLRVVGGAAGWMKKIPSKPYRSSFGLKLTPILQDAAREVGETIRVSTDRTIGENYIREEGPAARVLAQLAPNWWVGPDGITYVGFRSERIVTTPFDVIASGTNLAIGRVEIATDSPAGFSPGSLFSSSTLKQMKISTLIHRLSKDKLRTEIWIA